MRTTKISVHLSEAVVHRNAALSRFLHNEILPDICFFLLLFFLLQNGGNVEATLPLLLIPPLANSLLPASTTTFLCEFYYLGLPTLHPFNVSNLSKSATSQYLGNIDTEVHFFCIDMISWLLNPSRKECGLIKIKLYAYYLAYVMEEMHELAIVCQGRRHAPLRKLSLQCARIPGGNKREKQSMFATSLARKNSFMVKFPK